MSAIWCDSENINSLGVLPPVTIPDSARYSGLAPGSFIALAHFSTSSAMMLSNDPRLLEAQSALDLTMMSKAAGFM